MFSSICRFSPSPMRLGIADLVDVEPLRPDAGAQPKQQGAGGEEGSARGSCRLLQRSNRPRIISRYSGFSGTGTPGGSGTCATFSVIATAT